MRLGSMVAGILLCLAGIPAMAQKAADPVQQLIEQERLRSRVESAFAGVAEARATYTDKTAMVEAYTDIAHDLGTGDPAVVPLLVVEALQADPETFYLAAYALGLQGTPEAVEGLVEAIERADGEKTGYGKARKVHLVWALAAAGDVRALRLSDAGAQPVGDRSQHRNTTLIEAVSILTQPESLEILHEELMREGRPTANDDRRTLFSMRAIAKIGDPSSLPILLDLLKSENTLERMEAGKGLSLHPGKESVDALFAAFGDPSATVHSIAAHSLLKIMPRDRFEQTVAALDTISSPTGRGALYKLLVRLDSRAAIPVLAKHITNRDPKERLAIYEALATIRTEAAVDLLLRGLSDPDRLVGIVSMRALGEIDEPRTRRVLLRNIDSPRWVMAQVASEVSAQKRIPGAADAIRQRLLRAELPKLVRSAEDRPNAEWLLDRLVELEDIKAIPGLEASREIQRDGFLVQKLDDALQRLRAARDAGEDLARWEALAFHETPEIRETAYRHLAHSADAEKAAEILASAFGRVEHEEARRILDFLVTLDSAASQEVVERVLTSEQYQRPELYLLRDAAAWAARRLGGERMTAALKTSIESRFGRDIRPILYYTQLTGAAAIPLIERLLVPRMRYNTLSRGNEYLKLRELLSSLKLGNPIDTTDLPPTELKFN